MAEQPATAPSPPPSSDTNTTAVTNVVVAFLEVVSSFLRLQHTGAALSQCLQGAAVAIENPLIIKALQRILQTAAAACETPTVMDSVASSLDAAASKLKHDSVTIESFVQVVLTWSTVFLTWVNSFLDKDQLRALLDTVGPVVAGAKQFADYSMSYPLVAYVVQTVHAQAAAQFSAARLLHLVQSSQMALSKAQSLTASAWGYVYPPRVDAVRRAIHRDVVKRCDVSFAPSALEDMVAAHASVQRALLQLAMEQRQQIDDLTKAVADTEAYATELAEALASGPRAARPHTDEKDATIRALQAELAATNAFANELAEAIARGPPRRRDAAMEQQIVLSESFGLDPVE
ncbi:Aste57867_25462 [Aphanomyces stellatus]|uniref:Aste57867_25462 protein n=1 Tax=Aphanomyces stellatus TaxID=120398 RepID=A0A485LVM9_9STRA|nr:hypothetical protein As57867_025383 [Aphanomyces stellatus]VFU02085.1 Aste57867_25462 [Aphanomyces stellatus]